MIIEKNRNAIRVVQRAALAALGAVLCWAPFSCDEVPMYPQRTRWERVATYSCYDFKPANIAEGPDGEVYAAGWSLSGPGEGLIYAYDGHKVEESFRGGNSFTDIGYYDGAVWAVGTRWEESEFRYRPYVVRLRSDTWEEMEVPDEVDDNGFAAFFPTATATCWIAGYHNLYTYSGGNWRRVLETTAFYNVAVSPGNQAFYYRFDLKEEKACIVTSADSGVSWVSEEVKLDNETFRLVIKYHYADLAAGGEKLYISTRLLPYKVIEKSSSGYYNAVISREPAPPGEGLYGISFLAQNGDACVEGIWSMAFRSATEGYACGRDTAVALRGGTWYPEIVEPYGSRHPEFYDIAVGASCYWAYVIERPVNSVDRYFCLYRAER